VRDGPAAKPGRLAYRAGSQTRLGSALTVLGFEHVEADNVVKAPVCEVDLAFHPGLTESDGPVQVQPALVVVTCLDAHSVQPERVEGEVQRGHDSVPAVAASLVVAVADHDAHLGMTMA
jgi:hypothetical protein